LDFAVGCDIFGPRLYSRVSTIQTFGKYQILERIATGGMAEIYKAKLEGIGGFQRTFAIKRILPNLSQNSEYITMLVDEAKVAGLLSHANIVQILDLGQVDNIWYIAMEYVHGRDLGAVLRRARQKGLCLPVPHTVFIAIELLKGLEYAHQRQVMRGGRPVALNIIHRDVSPPNVLLSFQGEVKLTDFGIARASLKAMETVAGVVKGRFDYMSPEQAAAAKDLDQRSDLFAVGVVLYEMLTGHHPFRTDSEIGTVERVRTGNYIPVAQRNGEVPFGLETIVDRVLQVDREERYPSATAFKEALDKFFHDAGFIFTHATLATYVKGLFPEASGKSSAVPQKRRGTDPDTEVDELVLPDPDSPTRPVARPTHNIAFASPDTDSTAIRPVVPYGGGDFSDDDDQVTLIRKAPPLDGDTLVRDQAPMWEDTDADQETVIRKGLVLDEEGSLPRVDEATLKKPKTGGSPKIRTSTTGSSRRRRRRRPAIGVLGSVIVICLLLFGIGIGAFITALSGFVLGFRHQGADANHAPTIRVEAPRGTAVMLNGDAVGGPVSVNPGEANALEVVLKGYEPYRQTITLSTGEERVIVVSAETLKKQKQ
jgi:serine/threonine protein kinase